MKRLNFNFLWVLMVFIFLMVVNPVNARVLDLGVLYNLMKLNNVRPEEAFVVINVLIELVKREVKKALIVLGIQILSLDRLDFDLINRLVIMEGVVELLVDIVRDMNDIAGGGEFKAKHRFNISFKLLMVKKLVLIRYFQIEFVEFKLDGYSYLNAFNRVL